jgi:hypothetical protein
MSFILAGCVLLLALLAGIVLDGSASGVGPQARRDARFQSAPSDRSPFSA